MKELSKKQREVYDFLVQSMHCGASPTVREIGSAVGLRSPSSVQSILNTLEEYGYIKRDPLLKRSVRIANRSESMVQIPLLGTVAAGQPILADSNIESYIPYSGRVSDDKTLFALKVRGESMKNAGILDGDIVFVEESKDASNREKVVALIGDEATVKTFFREKGHIRLQPENDDFEPIICEEDEVTVLGKVIGLTRFYK